MKRDLEKHFIKEIFIFTKLKKVCLPSTKNTA